MLPTESAVDAIRKARANEHKVYICTGRSKAEVYPNLWEIGLDGMIGGNGSYVEDHGKVVMHQLITKEQCIHVVDWLHARDAFPDMIFGGELYRDDVNKISYVLTSYKDFEDAKKEFPDLQNGTWGGAGELAIFGDLGVKGITKAHAVECLLDYLRARHDRIWRRKSGYPYVRVLRFKCVYGQRGRGGQGRSRLRDGRCR